ncbi:glycosyltransferase family 2 protein [Marinobacter shengliensis]
MITVLTPTFNRAHTLPKLFDSLMKQSVSGFEWLVIDDGSSDGTSELVDGFREAAPFPVRCLVKKNGGKHTALNEGVKAAADDWVFIVDSDDMLVEEAIQKVETALSEFGCDSLVGLGFRTMFPSGKVNGVVWGSVSNLRTTPSEAPHIFRGDLAYIFRRSKMAAHPFPVIPGERFVPELFIWNKISDEGEIIYFPNTPIYICEYLEDGYSQNFKRNLRKNPRGFGIHYRAQIGREKQLVMKAKCLIRYLQCGWFAWRNAQ